MFIRLLYLTLVTVVTAQVGTNSIVETKYGLVKGIHDPDAGYTRFTGIRYAEVPTGQNRYAGPLPPPSWEDIFEANLDNINCPQMSNNQFIGTEDCLTLNIFTPDTATKDNPRTVIVYIHGGAYYMGSSFHYIPDYLIAHDIVFVTINFRLGVFGLLCLKHELIPGNVSFKDQIAALRWIKENIAAFGGNSDNITIMGHSSGGASVDLITLSPMSTDLFDKSVSVSASARAFWAVNSDPVTYATTMARTFMGYDGESIEELVQFYINADSQILATASFHYFLSIVDGSLPFAACVEETFPGIEPFLTENPENILASRQYTPKPKMYGVANREYVNMISPLTNVSHMYANVEEHLPTDLHFESNRQKSEIAERVRAFYFDDQTTPLESYVNFRSDAIFYYSVARAAGERRATSSEPVYMFEFTYESTLRLPRMPQVTDIHGAGHGDDTLYVVLPVPNQVVVSEEDRLAIDRYTTLLTNFAKYGNPTPQITDLIKVQWLPLTENQFNYLKLGSELMVLQAPHPVTLALWDQIYKEVRAGYRPIIETVHGLIRGTYNADGAFSSFTGIPYAEAPIGRSRYINPSSPPSWQGVFDANRNDIVCPQVIDNQYTGNEDCLVLNIFTPDAASPENPMPVMVLFHGGAYVFGSGLMHSARRLLKNDVVVVSVNFRLGAFGLLCLRHELAPGNAGLKDQVAAMRWLKENIALFGGDPNSITIFGHSSGAASVDLLTLSPMADGIFQRALTLSGSSKAFWAVHHDSFGYAERIARSYLNYKGNTNEELLQIYMEASFEEIALATNNFLFSLTDGSLPFGACVEADLPNIEAFLTDMPANILNSEEYTAVPKMYGVTDREYVSTVQPSEVANLEHIMDNLEEQLPRNLGVDTSALTSDIAERVKAFYLRNGTSLLEAFINFRSDVMWYYGSTVAARSRHSSEVPIYFFEFIYEGSLGTQRLPETIDIRGAGHSDDIAYLMGFEKVDELPAEDQLLIERFTTLCTNFAKFGNPTPQTTALIPVQWLPITSTTFHYLEIGPQLKSLQSPNEDAVALWDEIYAEVRTGSSAKQLQRVTIYIIFLSLTMFIVFH